MENHCGMIKVQPAYRWERKGYINSQCPYELGIFVKFSFSFSFLLNGDQTNIVVTDFEKLFNCQHLL